MGAGGTIIVRMKNHSRAGFTLIELLLFSAIFTLIIGAFITIFLVIVKVQSNQSASNETAQQGQFLIQQLQYYIGSARLVDMSLDTATSTLTLRESLASSTSDPMIFTVSSGTVYLQQGTTGTPFPLTSNRVTIADLSFIRHFNYSSSSPFGIDSVSYSFTVSTNSGTQLQYAQFFQSAASVFSPVGKIALIQQVKAENNTGLNVSNMAAAFPTNNESSSLLIAVVAEQGTATSSIADTNGNSWISIASTSYPAYSDIVTLYAALNVKAGANTTTVTFQSGATSTYASLFLYEYRGAATSSSFDAWGAQTQANVSTPTSPSVSPTSTVELLFGINDNSMPTTATFSPGTGYALETSSTAGNTTQMFVEDQNQDVTSPVSAAWQSSVNTSSTAMIATFR